MQDTLPMHVIATMHSAFPAKFGIPRQSGLVDTLRSTIVFQPEYRNPDALSKSEQESDGSLQGRPISQAAWNKNRCATDGCNLTFIIDSFPVKSNCFLGWAGFSPF